MANVVVSTEMKDFKYGFCLVFCPNEFCHSEGISILCI